jgi:hypothetical protein
LTGLQIVDITQIFFGTDSTIVWNNNSGQIK